MPPLVVTQQERAEETTPREAGPVQASKVSKTPVPPQRSQTHSTPAQQHESTKAGRKQLATTTATQPGGASKTGAPTSAQTVHAAKVKQRQENEKVVELVQSCTISREVCKRGLFRIVPFLVSYYGVRRVSVQRGVSVGCLVWFCWLCLLLVSRVGACRILPVFPSSCVRSTS